MDSHKNRLPATVLFVEDEADIREQAGQVLNRLVERCYMAENGAEGLRMFKELAPDIVVTDILMPVMNGLEMARQIRVLAPKTQIIVVSAFDDRENLLEMIDAGVNAFVLKPMIVGKFFSALEHCADYVLLTRKKDEYDLEREKMLAILEQQSVTDPLTGAYNRAKFNDALNVETERSRRYGNPLSLIMLDVDLFKQINDRDGHLVGDTVLTELCRTISGRLRVCDTFARWGGEEFMILLPDSSLANSRILAEQLRALIAEAPLGCPTQVTCSFGVTEFHPDDTLESFTGRSDKAMYMAKHNGRNRVEVI